MKEKFLKLGSTEITFMLNAKNNTAMGRTRVTGKVEPIVKKWLSKDEAKSYIGCSAIFLMLLACSLAEGEPEPGKLIIALLIVFITFVYVLVCNYLNVKRHGGESSMYR